LDADVARDLEPGVEVGEEIRVSAGRQAAIVVENAAAAVAEDKPPRYREAERRHAREVRRDRCTPRRDAKM
jgi:hypothetical protein